MQHCGIWYMALSPSISLFSCLSSRGGKTVSAVGSLWTVVSSAKELVVNPLWSRWGRKICSFRQLFYHILKAVFSINLVIGEGDLKLCPLCNWVVAHDSSDP